MEAHNHGIGPPRFSATDRAGLEPFAGFILDSFPDRPYGATVWAGDQVYGEWFTQNSNGKPISQEMDRVLLAGDKFEVLSDSRSSDLVGGEVSERQMPIFGVAGQRTLEQLRVAVVGLGGTGSHMVRALTYLGVRHFTLIDQDRVELSNLNRLVTATPADLDAPKVVVAARAIRSIAPDANVVMIEENLTTDEGEITKLIADTDLIVGCVDDDGPRLLLNRLAVAHGLTYVDVATGITVQDGRMVEAGGRIVFVTPGGVCLGCTGELDVNEVRAYFLSDAERGRARRHGYVSSSDTPSPAVVSLNGLVVHTALNELCLWIAGLRSPAPRIDVDLLGNESPVGPRVTPRRDVRRRDGCVECGALTVTSA